MWFARVLEAAVVVSASVTVVAGQRAVAGGTLVSVAGVAAILTASVLLTLLRLRMVLPARITRGNTIDDSAAVLSSSSAMPKGPRSTMIVLGSGGHTTEMLRMVGALDRDAYFPRTYVCADTDRMSSSKLATAEADGDYVLRLIPRAREVRQSVLGTALASSRALVASAMVVLTEMPDVILTNGPGTCVPICVAAYIPRILGWKHIQIV